MLRYPVLPKGVYMYGGVGRGKSFIMDCFFNAVPLQRKTRLHFHEFMREVHRQLHELKGVQDPLEVLAKRMARVVAASRHEEYVAPGRNPFAYLFALFTPRLYLKGGGMGSMMAIVAIIACIGCPS